MNFNSFVVARFSSDVFRIVILLTVTLSLAGSGVSAEDAGQTKNVATRCAELMGDQADVLEALDIDQGIKDERHEFSALLDVGPNSLIHQHPWLIMNSAQRLLHMLYATGVREVPDRRVGFGTRKRYSFFSDAVDLTDGKFIVGHLDGIANVVTQVEANADGQPGKDHVTTLIGAPATGKSHLLTLIRVALLNGTRKNPEYYAYTFEWVNLSQFQELKVRLPSACTRAESPEAFKDPINDSPITLLPEAFRDKLLSSHEARVRSVCGRAPDPKEVLNPQSAKIRDVILAHYQKEKGSRLTNREIVDALNKHVKIRRLVLGDQETAPYLANQGKEPNLPRLFGSTNPLVKVTMGTDDPFSVIYGIFAKANGGVVFIDEILKNEPALLGQFLNLFSSHVVEVAPGVNFPADLLFLAASNTREKDDLRAKDPQHALLSRKNEITWNYVFLPDEVGRVLAMEIKDLMARPLGSAGGPFQAFERIEGKGVFKLYPEVEPFQPVQTPYGRYALKIAGAQQRETFISPHALEFMANVVTLTRLNFDREKVPHAESYPMVASNDAIFANPVVRLRVLLGQMKVTDAQLEDLNSISVASKEGSAGIDHRDVERWWKAAVERASSSASHGTVTPVLLFEVLKEQVLGDKVFEGNRRLQSTMILFAQIVFQQFTAPALAEDLNLALARSEGREVMDQVYDEVEQELMAIGTDSKAEWYVSLLSNERRQIARARLAEISEIYKRKQGRELSPSELWTWSMFQSRSTDPKRMKMRNTGLMQAIAAYQTKKILASERMSIRRMLDVADGTVQQPTGPEQVRARDLMTILQDELGYNVHSAKVAIEALASLEADKK